MADLTKRGGRRYPNIKIGVVNFQEQSIWLPSVGRVLTGTTQRTILVGYRNRTIVVNQR